MGIEFMAFLLYIYRFICYNIYMYKYEIIVVGAGHAGIEAAVAAAKLGHKTLLLTINLWHIGHMPCNCSIGGPAKSHLTREIDALGGQMALAADNCYTHIRMLNTGKGPAVRALRVQADKRLYEAYMFNLVTNTPNLDVRQAMVDELLIDDKKICGVKTATGISFESDCVILTTGTFLRGLIHIGNTKFSAGRAGEFAADKLSESLISSGFELGRLKTGTPARVDKKTIDYTKCELQNSEPDAGAFSFLNVGMVKDKLLDCYLTYTNEETQKIIMANLHRSALYGGMINGVGPRYCPSIEDKYVRFTERISHQVFLEQEGFDTDEIYLQGVSSSMPEEVQEDFIKTIYGLEDAKILRPGYAIEYDFLQPTGLKRSLESKKLSGLFCAGQINGTSGYEEAAGQGLVAGINAAMKLEAREPLVIHRDEGYLGVLIDDLVTKGVNDPYRLLTSRSEYRLLLRQDNADLRLTAKGREIGLVDDTRWAVFNYKKNIIDSELEKLENITVRPSDKDFLAKLGINLSDNAYSLKDILKRPEISYKNIVSATGDDLLLDSEIELQIELAVKYEGYIKRQKDQVKQSKHLERTRIPLDFDYEGLKALSKECKEKLIKIRPETVGQASRIPGITPADMSLLSVYLHQRRN